MRSLWICIIFYWTVHMKQEKFIVIETFFGVIKGKHCFIDLLNCFYSVFTELKISHSLEDVLPNLLYFCKDINLVHTWTELYTAHSQILNIHICFVCKKVSFGHCSANWNLFNWLLWFMSSYRDDFWFKKHDVYGF